MSDGRPIESTGADPGGVAIPLLVVSAHPYEGSFSRAVATVLASHPGNRLLELYDVDFSPVLTREELASYLETGENGRRDGITDDVREVQELLRHARSLAFVFPVWWGGPPALLKGFFDRVLLPGFAFHVQSDGSVVGGMNWIERVHVFCSMDSPDRAYANRAIAAMRRIVDEVTFGFCGIEEKKITWHVIPAISEMLDLERSRWLDEAEEVGRAP